MKRVIGSEIVVYLKGMTDEHGDLSGVLVDVSDDNLYVQESSSNVFIIPRENVCYCTTNKVPLRRHMVVGEQTEHRQTPQPREVPKTPISTDQQENSLLGIHVFLNGDHITYIPTPPTIKLHTWNDNIMRVLSGNQEVRGALAGKVQKSIEYHPGEVYITAENVVPPSQMPDKMPGGENSFSMNTGSPIGTYLSPSQMATRLQNISKRGKEDDEDKTNM